MEPDQVICHSPVIAVVFGVASPYKTTSKSAFITPSNAHPFDVKKTAHPLIGILFCQINATHLQVDIVVRVSRSNSTGAGYVRDKNQS